MRCAKLTIVALLLLVVLAPNALAASRGATPSDLINAAKAATVSVVDYQRKDCKDDRTIEDWLKEAVGDAARSIKWTGGACKLANRDNPRDAGTKWCAQATIAPNKGGPPATIEIYFEAPKGGQPGKLFVFRASVRTKAGWDTMRETLAFENNWGETYVKNYEPQSDPCG